MQVYLSVGKSLKVRVWHSPAIALHHHGAYLQRLCFASLRAGMGGVNLAVIKANKKSSLTSGKAVGTMTDHQILKGIL